MFGNLLIDKLRISLKLNSDFKEYQAKDILDNLMSKNFKDGNYNVNFDKSYFRVTFTPTLYVEDVQGAENRPLINLDMISEETLLALLEKIYEVLGDGASVKWIDLTKNILTRLQALEYIKALSKRKIKYSYKVVNFTSKRNQSTLTLSPLKRANCTNCRNSNRQITFYSKVDELKTKAKARFLDNVWLSEGEIEQLPEGNYDQATGRLFLKGLNIIRCEQRYKYTKNNIEQITKYLTGSKDEKELTLPILIDLLKKGELYSRLDEFYTYKLWKHIFYDDINETRNERMYKHEDILVDLVNEFDIDIMDFVETFSCVNDYKNKFGRLSNKIYFHTYGMYYKELYEKLNIKEFICSPQSCF